MIVLGILGRGDFQEPSRLYRHFPYPVSNGGGGDIYYDTVSSLRMIAELAAT